MIEKPRLKNYRNGEFLQFFNNVISTVTQNNPDTLGVTPQLNALKTVTAEAEALFHKEKGSIITDELIALDERRDRAIVGIAYDLESKLLHFNPSVSNSANVLKNNLDTHGTGIAKENYQEETAILKKIVADWTTKVELVAAVTTLGLTDWLAELDNANKAFDVRFIERNNQQGAAPVEKLREKRVAVTAAYEKLTRRLNSAWDFNDGVDPYGKTVREINALIEKYNTQLVNRGKAVEEEPVSAGS